jgi:hypothetical protein
MSGRREALAKVNDIAKQAKEIKARADALKPGDKKRKKLMNEYEQKKNEYLKCWQETHQMYGDPGKTFVLSTCIIVYDFLFRFREEKQTT